MNNHWTIIAFLLVAVSAHSSEYFVDVQLRSNCGHYNVNTRQCDAGGDRAAFFRLNEALAQLRAGDTLYLREGSYSQIRVGVSGQQDARVTVAAYGDDDVHVRDRNRVGVLIANQSYVTIRGLKVLNSIGFGRLEEATHITIEDNEFVSAIASGTTGALKLVRSSENRIINNSFNEGSDLLLLQDDSDRNLVEGNRFYSAGHSLISIRCGNRNIIRDNLFNNPDQKAVEIFDCEGVSDAPFRLDSTVGNIVEWNRFFGTAASDRNHRYNAIQHGGQFTIVRNNLFVDNLGGGVNFQYYPDESLFVYGNRLYHNTFVGNRCSGIIGQDGARSRMYDNAVANNLLYDNVDCGGRNRQVDIRRKTVDMLDNLVSKADPGFRRIDDKDFCLRPGAAAVDKAPYLTTTRDSGSGSVIPVRDASWFSDGYGVLPGDKVRLESGSIATVIAVDIEGRSLAIDVPTTWTRGEGVHLAYEGAAPDFGALEFNSAKCESTASAE
jgi:hypothetical protein